MTNSVMAVLLITPPITTGRHGAALGPHAVAERHRGKATLAPARSSSPVRSRSWPRLRLRRPESNRRASKSRNADTNTMLFNTDTPEACETHGRRIEIGISAGPQQRILPRRPAARS